MKKVIVVSKTHLDLGFTDLAANILDKYINEFIPSAIQIAKQVNIDGKRFVWTTGSWLLTQALRFGDKHRVEELTQALKNGDVVAHGLPFTTHTELLDGDTFDYGLQLIDNIDKISGRKTISAKMTDVPGHTIAIVPYLAKQGIKLLHIGVNGASKLPQVPECFLWEKDGSQLVVIYSGEYGGEFRCPYIDDILYFDHTVDNRGARSAQAVVDNFNKIQAKYLDYKVEGGSMDYIAEQLWTVKDKLPKLTSEIGDSWIHGIGTDPLKVGATRQLIALKNQWLADGSLKRDSEEYRQIADKILCVAEHTWGVDSKIYFGDYNHYLRKDFDSARVRDKVDKGCIFKGFPYNFYNIGGQLQGDYHEGSYKMIEKSWQEQRDYILSVGDVLTTARKQQWNNELQKFSSVNIVSLGNINNADNLIVGLKYCVGNWSLAINGFGAIQTLTNGDSQVIARNNKPIVEYRSYGQADYDFFLQRYTRDFAKNRQWSASDFLRPLLKYVDKKYKKGTFEYKLSSGKVVNNVDKIVIYCDLVIEEYCNINLGAPKRLQVVYTIQTTGVGIQIVWKDKPANRLTEGIFARFYFATTNKDVNYVKMGRQVCPTDIVVDGNRNLSAVESIEFTVADSCDKYRVLNQHSPLVSLGAGKILQFDNEYGNVGSDGIAYNLYNNVWGTNFPLWYGEDAYFNFEITKLV